MRSRTENLGLSAWLREVGLLAAAALVAAALMSTAAGSCSAAPCGEDCESIAAVNIDA